MTLLSIDPEKCKKDGICVMECPRGIIEQPNKNEPPSLVENGEESCINCGHCVAVCPHGALSLDTMKPGDCLTLEKELAIDDARIRQFLCGRRSIRTYRKDGVDEETLKKALDMARYAPSGHNRQPVGWLVIRDYETVNKLAGQVIDWMRYMLEKKPDYAKSFHMDEMVSEWEKGNDRVLRGAPHLAVAHALKDDLTAPAACTIALAYLELAATGLGLGTCWAGYFSAAAGLWPPLQKELGLPEGRGVFGAMMIGLPKYRYHRIPLRNQASITWR